VIEFRDRRVAEMGERLVVGHLEDSIKRGTVRLAHPLESRNGHQTVALLEAIEEHRFDVLMGGARRDEEKARAKERIFSHRDSFGQWQPKEQRPELWTLFNTRIRRASTCAPSRSATGPSSTCGCTSPARTSRCPSLYYAHDRQVIRRKGLLVPLTEVTPPEAGETVETATVRFPHRRRHDLHLPGGEPGRQRHRDRRRDAAGDRQRARRHPHGRPHLRRLDGAPQEGRLFLMSTAAPIQDHRALRFLTAGSVDDGKSTLIGRLLFDSRAILADQLDTLEKKAAGAPIDLSLLTDGLEAEREQGITIDVAYRYFATRARKFIIADAPGHEQYTRNMVTAAAGSDAAVVLVDITKLDTHEERPCRCCRRRAATRCWPTCCACPASCSRSTSSTRSRSRRRPSTPSATRCSASPNTPASAWPASCRCRHCAATT
jgi:signal recognition particle receptor subunit beta